MVELYVRLYSTRNATTGGEVWWQTTITMPDDQFITALEMGVFDASKGGEQPSDTDARYDPLVRVPFSMHGDVKTLHTVCRRFPDETIETVEW